MIYKLNRQINDVARFDVYLKTTYPDYSGILVDDGDFYVDWKAQIPQDTLSSINTVAEPTQPVSEIIGNRIMLYQTRANALLIRVYTDNTLQSMSVSDSAYLLNKLAQIIRAVREGLFPTALYLLDNTLPDTVFTQARKDRFRQLLTEAMV